MHPVTTAAWAPDGQTFVMGSLDIQAHLCVWDTNGRHVYTWPGGYRVQDCAISPDGQRLITISTDKRIHVYNYRTREEEYNFELQVALTCISISQDSKYMLVNMADNEIQLLEIETRKLVGKYAGQKQGKFVIRSHFGGAAENFIISGSQGRATRYPPPWNLLTPAPSRLAYLHLAQSERQAPRNPRRSSIRLRQRGGVEPSRPVHVRVGRR